MRCPSGVLLDVYVSIRERNLDLRRRVMMVMFSEGHMLIDFAFLSPLFAFNVSGGFFHR